jgi:ribosomal protein S18 acetylase RimI-like enzyme
MIPEATWMQADHDDLAAGLADSWPRYPQPKLGQPRLYRHKDLDMVTTLFTQTMRELAPPGRADEFEGYIVRAKTAELDHIVDHFTGRKGFFVVVPDSHGQSCSATVAFEQPQPNTIELRRLYVASACRRGGLGSRLVALIEHVGELRGATQIVLDTAHIQQDAIRLYLRLGYSIEKKVPTIADTGRAVSGLERYHMRKVFGAGRK